MRNNAKVIRCFDTINSRKFYTCYECKSRTLIDLEGTRVAPYRVKIPCMHCGKTIWDITVVADLVTDMQCQKCFAYTVQKEVNTETGEAVYKCLNCGYTTPSDNLSGLYGDKHNAG